MSNTVVRCSVVAALGGFLFGFDTVVISGAEQAIQRLWGLRAALHGLVISAALWGTVAGALAGGWPTEHWGRRRTLFAAGVLYFVSAAWSGLATGVYALMFARFIGGIGVGISTVAAPLYIAEISPASARGRLAGMFQFNIVFGILAAYLSNALLGGVGRHAWRWMLGVEAFPALLFTVLSLWLVESPRWLITHQGDRADGLRVFRRINPALPDADLEALADEVEASALRGEAGARLFTRRLARPILLAFLIAFFNQFSGVNAILYFAPRIFELTGLAERAALLQSVGVGATNLIFTFAGLWLIDRLGRRTLLTMGSFGYIASLGLCAWAFHSGRVSIVPACIFAFIAAHAVGQGAVIWVFISEIFPNRNRAAGQTLGSSTHWICAALITLVFPKLVEAFQPWAIFAAFCGMMVLQLLWVRLFVPETMGVPLERMPQTLGLD
ncbi:MAG TPA: sugar porter family MFS transporter [Vicinamibacterales bacterium]|mgnify:FL=1|nr:sugar porter family MFS transporter [Vicinamibacterales bacterium]HOQ59756.1 sugar porter family MFS transporter [Vicinamibacterales bacterium]